MSKSHKKKTSAPVVTFDQVFKIEDSGAEQGVFAATNIQRNAMICADSFVWVLNDLAGLDEESESKLSVRKQLANAIDLKTRQTKMYEEQYSRLCEEFSTRVPRIEDEMQHLHPKQLPGERTGEWLYNVLKINGWLRNIPVQCEEAGDEAEEQIMLCIYKGSKFNHSCRPSMEPRMILPTKPTLRDTCCTNATGKEAYDFWLHALTDVAPGEEATVSYIGADEIDQHVVERRRYLQEKWGFECDCVRCREDLRTLQVERENRAIVDTLANKRIFDLMKEHKRVLSEQRIHDQHGREKRAKKRHTATATKTADVSADSQTKSASPLPPLRHTETTPSPTPSSPSQPISPRRRSDVRKTLPPTPPPPLHSQTPTPVPVLPLSYVREESPSPPPLASLWQNTEIPSSSIEMSPPQRTDEYNTAISSDGDETSPLPEHNPHSPEKMSESPPSHVHMSESPPSPEKMSESPPSRQTMQEPPHSTEHMSESPPASVDALRHSAEQASVVQPVKQPRQEVVPVASGNTPTKIRANCADELRNFLDWCRVGLFSFWHNADVFTIMSCLIAMRVRYRFIENMDTTQQAKVALSSEIHGCFTSYYQKICQLFINDKSYADIPAAGLSMYAYDSMFCSETLASCVHEIAGISMIAYSPENRHAPRLLREQYCHITRGWFHCLQRHLTGIDKELKAIRQKKPPPVERIQLPAHIRHPLTACLVPSQTVWIRILMAACTHVIQQLDENTEF